MKRVLCLSLALPAAMMFGCETAPACGIHPAPLALIHSALPNPLPAGTIIAEVKVGREANEAILPYGLRVRVLRMIQGEPARTLILRTGRQNSCWDAFGNGRRGYIIGTPRGVSEGIAIVRPIFVLRQEGYRLPDGYELAPPGPPSPGDVVIDD